MKKQFFLLVMAVLCSFKGSPTLRGTWEFIGDVYNGKKNGATTDYSLERKYSGNHFEASLLEKGVKPDKYETGDYQLTADSCFETQTWCSQPSKLIGVTVHYHYTIISDTLTLTGTLPNGSSVSEYWKRLK